MLLTPSFYKDVSGHQIAFYESIGRSDVLVFLVHGNSCNASYFKKQLESPLGEKYHFISFDFPGHGNSAWSEAPENTYCIKGFADILTEIIRAYNKPCLVVSHSLGANIALFAGANMNSCIKGFFCSGLTLIDTPDDASQALLPNEALPLFFQQDLTHAERIRMAMSELFLKRDDDIAFFEYSLSITDPLVRPGFGKEFSNSSFFYGHQKFLSINTKPVAMVEGADDEFINQVYTSKQKIPALWKATFFEIAQASHWPHWENPQQMNRLLDMFIQDYIQSNTPKNEDTLETNNIG